VEIWPIRNLDEKIYLILERIIFGPVKDSISKKWKRRKNAEIELLFRSINITDAIRNRRLSGQGMPDEVKTNQ